MNKHEKRVRRSRKARIRIREMGVPRLSVHRTGRHLYAQVIQPRDGKVVAVASTLQKDVSDGLNSRTNKEAAARIGTLIAERTKAAGVDRVAFDRSGYRYHGRVKALADAAREAGLNF